MSTLKNFSTPFIRQSLTAPKKLMLAVAPAQTYKYKRRTSPAVREHRLKK